MKPRTVIMTFEITTDLPVKVLRGATLFCRESPHLPGPTHIHPVNKPEVNVVQASKRKRDR